MKNKEFAIFGIGIYILSIFSSATNSEGNHYAPATLIIISGLLTKVFIIAASIRLWKESKIVSIFLSSSFILFFGLQHIVTTTSPAYGSPIILLFSFSKLISILAFIWAISRLWVMGKKESNKIEPSEPHQSDGKWVLDYNSFKQGKELYFKGQLNEALILFDSLIENGYEDKKGEVYDLKACCLQGLNYEYEAIENFNKAIIFSPNDCNRYFSRSISRSAILDFEGEISDLEKAIQLSNDYPKINESYIESAKEQGYDSLASLFKLRIALSKSTYTDMSDDSKEMRLSKIKSRFDNSNNNNLSISKNEKLSTFLKATKGIEEEENKKEAKKEITPAQKMAVIKRIAEALKKKKLKELGLDDKNE